MTERESAPISIAEMQEIIMAQSWQWKEHVYNDGRHSNCSLEFTRDKSPQALIEYPRPKDCVGWGRFEREHCWRMAYDVLCVRRKYG